MIAMIKNAILYVATIISGAIGTIFGLVLFVWGWIWFLHWVQHYWPWP